MISVIVPVHNAGRSLERCLQAVADTSHSSFECVVVDDSSTDCSKAIYSRFPVRSVHLQGGPFGPAFARNMGAELAQGDILFFVDSDTVVHADALDRVSKLFDQRPEIDAVFGSYDESPDASEFVSQFKNLSHHFVHQHGREEGSTFWSGCGAVRREAFMAAGGFDAARYPRPSIEDIDLGRRMKAAGRRILLDKQLRTKHLKRWTLRGMIQADVFYRGIPWTQLILEDRSVPNDLNLRFSQRLSAILVYVMLATVGLMSLYRDVSVTPLLAGLSLLAVGNWHWPGGVAPFESTRRAQWLALALLAAISVSLSRTGHLWLLVPLTPVGVAVLAGPWLPESRLLWNRVFFLLMLFGLVVALASVLGEAPIWLLAPLVAALSLIVALNYPFFAFFARQRGVLFAVASVPFQLLYFFYSIIAFGIGALLYLRHGRAKRQHGRPSIVGP